MKRPCLTFLMLLMLLPSLAHAEEPFNISLIDRSQHRWFSFNSPSLEENLVCASTNWDEITLFDLSQPDTIREAYVWFDYETSFAAVQDGYLYTCWIDTLVSIYDLSDPYQPERVATILSDGYSGIGSDAIRVGDVLYVAESFNGADFPWDETTGLRWYDISDLSAIELIDMIPMHPCSDISIAGNMLIVEDQGIAFDISDPAQPDSIEFAFEEYQLLIDTLAVSESSDSIFVSSVNQETFDLARLGACAKPVSFISSNGGNFNGSTLVLQRGWDYLTFFDLSNPNAPAYVSTYSLPEGFPRPILGDDFCFVYDRKVGLSSLDIQNLAEINETAFLDRFGEFIDLVKVDNHLYTLIAERGIAVYDVSEPDNPFQKHFIPIDGWLHRPLVHHDGRLLVNVHNYQAKVQFYDIQPDGNLVESREIDMEYGIPILNKMIEDTLYCISNRGITLYDLSTPDSTPIIWMQPLLHQNLNLREAAIVGDWIYLNSDQFGIMRKSRVTNDDPEVIIPFDSYHGHSMAVRENAIYLHKNGILESYSRPETGNPEFLDDIHSPYLFDAARMVPDGDHLFFPQGYHGVAIVNVWNRFRLQVSGYYPTADYPGTLVTDGSLLYTISSEWIAIYDCSSATGIEDVPATTVPTSFSLEAVYPNPFNPTVNITFTVPHISPIKAVVYDLLGRQVATLADNLPFQPGYHTLSWTPRGSSGVYFVRLEAGNEWQAMRKVVFMK